jgi:hypothetical protein
MVSEHRAPRRQRGSALIVGLILLSLVMLLALSGAGAARVELQLAHNEQFRENAASAASAGIESAISRIVTASDPATIPAAHSGEIDASLPGSRARFETTTRFLGFELGLPQAPGLELAGAHFEILSTGHAARRAWDRQRALVMHVVPVSFPAMGSDCDPAAPGSRCVRAGDWRRLAWQRLPRQ